MSIGPQGETIASEYLVQQGYRILKRNFRTRHGEIDIVAQHRGTLVFIEVKTRRTSRYGRPADSVTSGKQARLRRMATIWLAREVPLDAQCRFDVVTIDMDEHGCPIRVHLIQGAF